MKVGYSQSMCHSVINNVKKRRIYDIIIDVKRSASTGLFIGFCIGVF